LGYAPNFRTYSVPLINDDTDDLHQDQFLSRLGLSEPRSPTHRGNGRKLAYQSVLTRIAATATPRYPAPSALRQHQLAHTGQFPVRIVRVGTHYNIPTAELLKVLGVASLPWPQSITGKSTRGRQGRWRATQKLRDRVITNFE
jgi:hypothetical protein